MEISDWGDLKQFDDGNFNFGSKKTTDNGQNNAEESQVDESQKQDESQNFKEGAAGNTDSLGYEITDWNDLRKFDDDHDDDWFKCQEKQLAEQYGGTFIKVKYSSNGRVAYFCELCLAECNAKKSLDLHCSGMKHLKKKDMWEKEGKPQPPINLGAGENAPGEKSKKRPNSPQPPKHLFPPGRQGSRDRMHPYDRSRDGIPPPYKYDSYYPRDKYYYGHDDRDRDINSDSTYGFARGPGGYGSAAAPDRVPSLPRYSPDRDRRYSPASRKDYDHGREKRYTDYEHRRHSPQRAKYYGDRRSRSRDRKRSPYGSRRDRTRSPYSSRSKRSRSISTGRSRAPPSPPKISSSRSDDVQKKVNLSNSPAGSLLQKLAECCVKSSEDADLALNVVAALAKSLKEYCQRNEETKLAELLMEAELKVGTVKALKAGMKMLSNFTADGTGGTITPGNMFPTYLGLSQGAPSQTSQYQSAGQYY